MQITAPYGYTDIVPLEKTSRVLQPKPGNIPAFIRSCGSLVLCASELQRAAHDYPITFAMTQDDPLPVAVMGFKPDENLFVNAQLKWLDGAYVPAFVRRYPYCLSRVVMDGAAQPDLLACVVSGYLDNDGKPLYFANGEPNDLGKQVMDLLQTFEADLERTRRICALLLKHQLFEPFSMVAQTAQGSFTIDGLQRISQTQLKQLPAKTLREFVENDVMQLIYTHWFSLDQFARLLSLFNASLPKDANKEPT